MKKKHIIKITLVLLPLILIIGLVIEYKKIENWEHEKELRIKLVDQADELSSQLSIRLKVAKSISKQELKDMICKNENRETIYYAYSYAVDATGTVLAVDHYLLGLANNNFKINLSTNEKEISIFRTDADYIYRNACNDEYNIYFPDYYNKNDKYAQINKKYTYYILEKRVDIKISEFLDLGQRK